MRPNRKYYMDFYELCGEKKLKAAKVAGTARNPHNCEFHVKTHELRANLKFRL